MNPEEERLKEQRGKMAAVPPWEKWGPYVSERGWGTIREDYSADGDAWNYFPHDHARLRAYRRSEDGIAGISDRFQILLFAPAFWNGCDPILKERLFGLNMWEGNHGEDVKEYYYHLDATPTHSYLKYLYKYPQARFPYEKLVEENQKRGVKDREYELIDTGIFNDNRYFDIFIEYAKADPEDLCVRIEAINRGPESAPLHILPQLWFRNQWSWEPKIPKPMISLKNDLCLVADDGAMPVPKSLSFEYHVGRRYLYATPGGVPLFTENETNTMALWQKPNATPYVKDAFHRYLVHGEKKAVSSSGTKAAIHYVFPSIRPGKSAVIHLRLTDRPTKDPLSTIDSVIAERKKQADQFYESIHPAKATEEEKAIQRQALSGLIWNKQIYLFDVGEWIEGDDPNNPPPLSRKSLRNHHWRHIISMRILSMPDKWEYPWFAAWDLAFHTLAFALVDLEFAKQQLWLLLFDQFQHPNGAIPAYEWEFSEVNPPVQAWAALKIFEYEKKKTGKEDFDFLEKCFHKLLLNFSWWINRVDRFGNNVFEGGFLGMDNIGLSNQLARLPEGCLLDQADGAGWISLLCLNLMRIALTLAKRNRIYEGLGIKFFQHFIYVTAAMRKGYWRHYDLWNEKDGFFYSFLRHPNGSVDEIPIRSLAGMIPFFACDIWDDEELKAFPEFYVAYDWIIKKKSELTDKCIQPIHGNKQLLGLLSVEELKRFLGYIWNPEEFRSEFGLRSFSKYHEKNPVHLHNLTFSYEPGEAYDKMKGGNSNWRGPIWFPLNFLLIDTLMRLGKVFQGDLQIQVGQESPVTISQMAKGFSERLLNLFKRDGQGRRPHHGDCEKFQKDPYFKDHFYFYEHFHGDTGRGLGASHQAGWTALIANLIEEMK